ncbi:MAG: DUF1624 domain-containing protein [Oscillospiraceae bacterium]|jgi:uncharacterized membrane protein|nr:DUF1624 domain-containing protein [Oscillospiraceae bacterium]MDD3260976.1 heparan-alpha-glucosaminide N-acetyltransferase [Oscillospiraceae bacterium]
MKTLALAAAAAAERPRFVLLDLIRGATVLSMILYHTIWDLVHLFGVQWQWFYGGGAAFWQQSICWTFIFLSGFCWPFGHKPLRRGLTVFAAGLLITLATLLFMPKDRIVFGILTFIGSAMLLMIPLEKLFRRVPAAAGAVGSMLLFLVFLPLNHGYVGFGGWNFSLPQVLYHGGLATYLGFLDKNFFSTDYFSLFPWLFLFAAGYFCCRIWRTSGKMPGGPKIPTLSFLGRHSLGIYVLHQPLVFFILALLFGRMPL